MNLIAKNKIAAYIEKHPESRVDLLGWLEQFPYREGKEQSFDHKDRKPQGCGAGSSSFGNGNYTINYQINHDAKTQCITWIGNREQLDQELKAMREMHFGQENRCATVEVVVVPPPPPDQEGLKKWAESRAQNAKLPFVSDNDLLDVTLSLTESEYEKELARAIVLFESTPNTPEFEELLALISSINSYEAHNLRFPAVYTFEIVSLRMNLFQLTPAELATMVEISEDDFNLFLSGKLTLNEEILAKLNKCLGILST